MTKKKTMEAQANQQLASNPGFAHSPVGREPMTGAQASYLKTLAEEVSEPEVYEQGLSKREASRRIEVLIEKLRLGVLPPHTD